MPPTRTRSKLSPALWEAVKTEILQILRDHARRRQTLSYSELVAKLTTVEMFHRSPLLKTMLCEISREEARADRGMLSVVVVQKGARGLPGDRFFELAEELGRAVTHREAAYEAEKELVFAANAAARRP